MNGVDKVIALLLQWHICLSHWGHIRSDYKSQIYDNIIFENVVWVWSSSIHPDSRILIDTPGHLCHPGKCSERSSNGFDKLKDLTNLDFTFYFSTLSLSLSLSIVLLVSLYINIIDNNKTFIFVLHLAQNFTHCPYLFLSYYRNGTQGQAGSQADR